MVVLAAGGMGTPRILETSGFAPAPTFFGDPVLCVAERWENARFHEEPPMAFSSARDGYMLAPYFDYLSFFFAKEWRLPAKDNFSKKVAKACIEQLG